MFTIKKLPTNEVKGNFLLILTCNINEYIADEYFDKTI